MRTLMKYLKEGLMSSFESNISIKRKFFFSYKYEGVCLEMHYLCIGKVYCASTLYHLLEHSLKS